MGRIARCLVSVGLFFIPFSVTDAQDANVGPGSRIRFRIDSSELAHEATLGLLTRDSLVLHRCVSCDRLRYGRADVSHLEGFYRKPSGSRMLTGFGYGGLAGLALGVIVLKSCHGLGDSCDGAILAVPFGGLLGGLIGVLTGYLTAYEWQPIAPDCCRIGVPR